MRSLRIIGAGLALTLLVGACGDDDDSDDSASDTSTVEEVATPQLTFDGTDCTYPGPAEVTDGVVVVELVNTSDANANVYVAKIDEGYTVDETEAYVDDPSNAARASWLADMGTGGAVRAEPGETIAWEGDLDAGEYVLLCAASAAPEKASFGSGLTVVEG